MQTWDLEVFKAIHLGWNSQLLDPLFWFLSYSGLGQVQAIGILLLQLHTSTRKWVVPLLLAIIVGGVGISDLLKPLVPRDRPSRLPIAHPQENFEFRSFPSGHTTSSFALAFMLVWLTKGTRQAWIGWTAIVWAIGVGMSRIYRGVHWPTDVLGGMFAGLLGTCIVIVWMRTWKSIPTLGEVFKRKS